MTDELCGRQPVTNPEKHELDELDTTQRPKAPDPHCPGCGNRHYPTCEPLPSRDDPNDCKLYETTSLAALATHGSRFLSMAGQSYCEMPLSSFALTKAGFQRIE